MAQITAADVKRLREATGAGMMACKQALVDAGGDFQKAADLVRERTGARMDARVADRTAREGLIHAYLHAPTPGLPAKVGVLLQLSCETDFVAKSDPFRQLAKELALHIAAMRPAVVSEDQLDPATIEREREFARRQALDEGKPEHIVDRIVEGKLQAFYKESVLLNQPFFRDASGKQTVRDVISDAQGVIGEKILVARFARFEVGG